MGAPNNYPGFGNVLYDVYSELCRRKANTSANILRVEAKEEILKEIEKRMRVIDNESKDAKELVRKLKMIFSAPVKVTAEEMTDDAWEKKLEEETLTRQMRKTKKRAKRVGTEKPLADTTVEKVIQLYDKIAVVEEAIPDLEDMKKRLATFQGSAKAKHILRLLGEFIDEQQDELNTLLDDISAIVQSEIPPLLRNIGRSIGIKLKARIKQKGVKWDSNIYPGYEINANTKKAVIRYVYYIRAYGVKDTTGKKKNFVVAVYTDIHAGVGKMLYIKADVKPKLVLPNKLRGILLAKNPQPNERTQDLQRFIEFLLRDYGIPLSGAEQVEIPRKTGVLLNIESPRIQDAYPIVQFLKEKPTVDGSRLNFLLDYEAVQEHFSRDIEKITTALYMYAKDLLGLKKTDTGILAPRYPKLVDKNTLLVPIDVKPTSDTPVRSLLPKKIKKKHVPEPKEEYELDMGERLQRIQKKRPPEETENLLNKRNLHLTPEEKQRRKIEQEKIELWERARERKLQEIKDENEDLGLTDGQFKAFLDGDMKKIERVLKSNKLGPGDVEILVEDLLEAELITTEEGSAINRLADAILQTPEEEGEE